MTTSLDQPHLYTRLDPSWMRDRIAGLPDQCLEAWQEGLEFPLPDAYAAAKSVVLMGMGGSAIGGDLIAGLATLENGPPITVLRNYHVPSWVGPNTLAIASSYSGNTEETLSGVQQAIADGIPVVGISSGGRLKEMLESTDLGWWVPVPGGQPPRSAFGHLFSRLMRVSLACDRLGLSLPEQQIDEQGLRDVVTEWDFVNNPDSQALDIASGLLDRQIGIVSAPELGCAGVRFANQLNENGGVFARQTSLPEMNHNEIIAWTQPEAAHSQMLILLTWDGMNERVAERIEWMNEDYHIFIHLLDSVSGELFFGHDFIHSPDNPIQWWAPGEVISETIMLDLSPVPSGDYRLGMGIYNFETGQRLRVSLAKRDYSDGWLPLDENFEVN